jgi:hypothetical protein
MNMSFMKLGLVALAVVGAFGCSSAEGEKVGTGEARYEESVVLVRSVTAGAHWVSAGPLPNWYGAREEARYGIRAHGDIALYACLAGNHTMASTDPGCEGLRRTETIGYLSATAGIPLYRCAVGGDHFVSTDAGCEGQRVEGLLGFVDSVGPGEAPSYDNSGGSGEGSGGGDGSGGDGSGGDGDGVGAGGSL